LKDNVQQRILTIASEIKDLVILVDSQQTIEESSYDDLPERKIVANFVVGPKRTKLHFTFETCSNDGDLDVKITCNLFHFSQDDFNEEFDFTPYREEISIFFEKAGITKFPASKYNGSDVELQKLWYAADIINHCVKVIVEKYGEEDDYGIPLGFVVDDIYKHFSTKFDTKKQTKKRGKK